MKSIRCIPVICLILLLISGNALAQQLRTTMAGARIVEGASLSQSRGIQFGSIPVPAITSRVVLNAGLGEGEGSLTDYTFIPVHPDACPGLFTLSGEGNAAYAITLPPQGTVKLTSGTNTLRVVGFNTFPLSAGQDIQHGILSESGTDRFTLGATLQLEAGTPAGNYCGTFGLCVNYN